MRKRLGKRAQAQMPGATVVGLGVGIIVLITLAIGFTMGFDTIFGFLYSAPGALEQVAQSCGISGANGLATSYCNEFKEVKIAGKDQWVNCNYLATEKFASFDTLEDGCPVDLPLITLANDTCFNEKLSQDKDLVNGELCKIWNKKV